MVNEKNTDNELFSNHLDFLIRELGVSWISFISIYVLVLFKKMTQFKCELIWMNRYGDMEFLLWPILYIFNPLEKRFFQNFTIRNALHCIKISRYYIFFMQNPTVIIKNI